MPEADDEAKALRAQSVLTKALQEAQIKNQATPLELFRGHAVHWEQTANDTYLIIYIRTWGRVKLTTSIPLKPLALDVMNTFHDDAEAVEALADLLRYLESAISDILPSVHTDLLARSTNINAKRHVRTERDKQLWKDIGAHFVKQSESTKVTELRKKLRGEQIGTGRPKGTGKSEERKKREAADFERVVEGTIRLLLATKGEMPTKTAVAKELGIGGVSPKTGVDSSLSSFSRKLKGLIDYKAIAERVRLNK